MIELRRTKWTYSISWATTSQSNRQIEAITEQVRQLTKAIYGSKSENLKYQAQDGQVSLFEDVPSFNEFEQKSSDTKKSL